MHIWSFLPIQISTRESLFPGVTFNIIIRVLHRKWVGLLWGEHRICQLASFVSLVERLWGFCWWASSSHLQSANWLYLIGQVASCFPSERNKKGKGEKLGWHLKTDIWIPRERTSPLGHHVIQRDLWVIWLRVKNWEQNCDCIPSNQAL